MIVIVLFGTNLKSRKVWWCQRSNQNL